MKQDPKVKIERIIHKIVEGGDLNKFISKKKNYHSPFPACMKIYISTCSLTHSVSI